MHGLGLRVGGLRFGLSEVPEPEFRVHSLEFKFRVQGL